MQETLLLTWTITPAPAIVLQWYTSSTLNPDERYFQYIDTILYYITQSDFNNIVFCENSNHNINDQDMELLHSLSLLYNKKLEFLCFAGNIQKTIELWYGYWDNECIDFACNNSDLLKLSQSWYKISGRYKCTNINTLIQEHKNDSIYFFKWVNRSLFSVCTALFKCNTIFYRENLYNVYDACSSLKPKSLESLYYYMLRKNFCTNICGKVKSFPMFSRGSNMITITTIQKRVLSLWLSDIWSVMSFIVDKFLYKYE
jgi:hypothetical protein